MESNHPDFYALRQKLYAREHRVKFRPGTVLLYRHDIWHRGTPVNHGKLRIVANLGYKRADAECKDFL
jgi:predicted 2-oxoglutarate/Fe(II)-dependent dioxygenase YbiX